MGYIKEQIRQLFKENGGYAGAKRVSTNWFKESLDAREKLDVKYTRKRFEPGKIYVFKYEHPVTQDTMPWWDKAPVVLGLDNPERDHTDYGLNLNLLPAKFRQEILDQLYTRLHSKIENNIKGSNASNAVKQRPLLDLKYAAVKKYLDRFGFGFAIRRYLPNLKKNQAVVSYESWPKIAICEFVKIHGASVGQIRKEFIQYNIENKGKAKIEDNKIEENSSNKLNVQKKTKLNTPNNTKSKTPKPSGANKSGKGKNDNNNLNI
jgi:hypothetical protein